LLHQFWGCTHSWRTALRHYRGRDLSSGDGVVQPASGGGALVDTDRLYVRPHAHLHTIATPDGNRPTGSTDSHTNPAQHSRARVHHRQRAVDGDALVCAFVRAGRALVYIK